MVRLSVQLEIVKGPARGKVFCQVVEPGGELTVGRDQNMDVWLPKSNVSRRHCTLRNEDGALLIADHASNPTRVSGRLLDGVEPVVTDDILLVGPFHLHLSIHTPDSPLFSTGPEGDLADMLIGGGGPFGGRPATSGGFVTGRFQSISPLVGQVIGGYQLQHTLGQGTSSEVFLGRREGQDAGEVAIKMIRASPPPTPEQVERFKREARILHVLTHPRIMQILDEGEHDGQLYLVCELLPGRTLDAVLRQKGRLSPTLSLKIACQVAEALAYAWEHQIIHRDINPRNLVIHTDGSRISVKVIDFGLGKQLAEDRLTASGEGFGTPGYMAPEQVETAGQADLRADVYGIGATLFRMVAGRPPTQARSIQEFLEQLGNDRPSLAEVAPDVPQALSEVVDRCLQRDPRHRFADHTALQGQLSTVLRSLMPGPVS